MSTKTQDTLIRLQSQALQALEGVTILDPKVVPTYGSARSRETCTLCGDPTARTDRNGIGRCCA